MFKRYTIVVVFLIFGMAAFGNVIHSDLTENIPATEWFDSGQRVRISTFDN